jgi:hypothetical protein
VNCRIVRAGALPTIGLIAAVGTAGLFASCVCAQTLVDPTPPAKWSPPTVHPDAKAKPAARVKSCSAYGAGFVNVPGTDTCVKVGGWVTVEGTAGR